MEAAIELFPFFKPRPEGRGRWLPGNHPEFIHDESNLSNFGDIAGDPLSLWEKDILENYKGIKEGRVIAI